MRDEEPRMGRHVIIAAAIIMLTFPACSEIPAQENALTSPNDLARFLAGMPISSSSPLIRLTQSQAFKEHSREMDRFWSAVLRENVFNMIPWRNQYVIPHFDYGTAFYPLSGGDFINMYILFPIARRYIMVSMEPPGRIPDPLSLNVIQLRSGLRALRSVTSNIALRNYMMSAVMKHEMRNPFLEGTLPTILLFAARVELDIRRIEPVGLNSKGEILPLEAGNTVKGEEPAALGNRIVFKASETGPEREILYLSMRLRWDSMDPARPEGKFLTRLENLNVIIKSAFYLLHRPSFEQFCRSLLGHTRLLIQDDSGMPFELLRQDPWMTLLFGHYTSPLSLRDMKHPVTQPELAAAFRERALPLPFNFGYGVWRYDHKSNLIMAIRKKGPRSR